MRLFAVDNGDVYISRGDDASFDIIFTGIDDTIDDDGIYVRVNEIPEDGTKVLFSVKVDSGRMKPLIEKELEVFNGFVTIPLESKDTNCLPFGDYTWDIRIFYEDAGEYDHNTPVMPHDFHVMGVVGNV